jgi:ectoine hydroxylase-related dioxygenase (phytanoyl-CoA dioxygenase family)
MHLTGEHMRRWNDDGYIIVENFLTPGEVRKAQRDLSLRLPFEFQYRAAPYVFQNTEHEGVSCKFPFLGDTLNSVSVHPAITTLVKSVAGAGHVVLTHSLVWAKYGGIDDYDQALHVDVLVQPSPASKSRGKCEQAGVIIFLVDMTEDNGPTYVVSRRHTRDLPLMPAIRPRHASPELYQHEQPVVGSAGLMLIYDMNTVFHRGSVFASRRGVRYSLHLIYLATDISLNGYNSYAGLGVIL